MESTGNPFRFGEPVSGDFFTGRYRERESMLADLANQKKVLLTAPRLFGKSSLARRVMSELEYKGAITVYIDLERAYSPNRFIEIYLAELLRAAFRQAKEMRAFIQELNPEVREQLLLKLDPGDELILDLPEGIDSSAVAAAVMELAQHTAEFKKRPCVVCFDEISQGGNLPDALRNRLWETVPRHASVGYLLGSLDESMKDKVSGLVHLPLDKIEDRYLRGYIKTRFENTGFRGPHPMIAANLALTEGHPHYTQMLCRKLWNQGYSGKIISPKILSQALDALLEVQSEFYGFLWSDLSLHQKNLLMAVVRGGGQKIFSQDYVARFGLGSFSTVQKSLSRLLARQILERLADGYVVRDPFFRRWLTRRMM